MPGCEDCPSPCLAGVRDCCPGGCSLWIVRAHCALAAWSEGWLRRAYLRAYGAIDRYYRLRFIEDLPEPRSDRTPITHFEMDHTSDERLQGFYDPETWEGLGFRWCADVAFVETCLPKGTYAFELTMLGMGRRLTGRVAGLFLDGRLAESITISDEGYEVSGRVEVGSGPGHFQIVSRRLRTRGAERRALGLAVRSLRFRPLEPESQFHA